MFSMDARDDESGIGLGARIAGVVFVFNALAAVYAGVALNLPVGGRLASIAIDFILGLLLIFGVRRVIPLCVLRTILGGVLYLAIALYGGDYATAALQIVLSGSLLGLLAGEPSSARIGLSATAAAGVLLITVGLLYNGTRIRNPDALLASNEIETIVQGNVQGLAFAYHLTAPSEEWFLRTDAVAKRDNPLVDRWIIRPDRDAHFIVIAEQFPSMDIDVGLYEKAVLDNLKNAAKSFELLESRQLWAHDQQSRYVRARALVQGMSIDYSYGIVVFQDMGYQFIGFASQTEFPAVEAEFRAIHDSVVIGER